MAESYPAIPGAVPAARRELTELALSAGASPDMVEAVRLAVSEAVTNAVLHAYPDSPGAVHVTAAVASSELWILVADDGCGLEGRSRCPGLGLGLALIAQVADAFTIRQRAARGVELQMRFDLARVRPGLQGGPIVSARVPAPRRVSTTMRWG
jgi:anti-sigma regulatory factor (Ser/Thr protein kinase)